MTPAEKWANSKNANDSKIKKSLKALTRGGQFMLNNPGYILGAQAGVAATGLGVAYADYKLSKPKSKGLKSPTKPLAKKVLNRSADRLMENPKNYKVLGKTQDRLIRSTGIKGDAVTSKSFDLNKKSINKRFLKESVTKTMGNVKKLTPIGLVTAIMQPKKVGDATLDKGKYRIVK